MPMKRETYTESDFMPMHVAIMSCDSPNHAHMLVGVINDTPPSLGEYVFWDEDQCLWFRPLDEILISLN